MLVGDLTETEQRLLEHAVSGELLAPASSADDPVARDPAQARLWSRDRLIRAELLVELLTGLRQPPHGRLRAIVVIGARITGALDLSNATIQCPLTLLRCAFDEPINLGDARTAAVRLGGSHLPGLSGDGLRTTGTLSLTEIVTTGRVSLIAAQVGGQLVLNGAQLNSADGFALEAWGIDVEHDMWCLDGFAATGGVRIGGARVGGSLGLGNATLTNPSGFALDASQIVAEKELTCATGFTADGAVTLRSGLVRGTVDLSGARLTYEDGVALDAGRLTVEENLVCADDFHVTGSVSMFGAHVNGALHMPGATIVARDGPALNAELIEVGQNVILSSANFTGELRLIDARVGGFATFAGATLSNPGGSAVEAIDLSVGKDLFFGPRFVPPVEDESPSLEPTDLSPPPADETTTVVGALDLPAIHVGGDLTLSAGTFINADGAALVMHEAVVEGSVYLRDLTTEGDVSMGRMRIAGSLYLARSWFNSPDGDAIDADRLVIDGTVFGEGGFTAIGVTAFTRAQVGGEIYFEGVTLRNSGKIALAARALQVGGDLRCRDNFRAAGEVRLVDAQIGGRLLFRDAELTDAHDGLSLDLDGVRAAALVLRLRTVPDGLVDLTNARVGTFSDDPSTWPLRLRLRGFTYDLLTGEGTRVKERLRWVARSDDGRYVPGPYDELAAAYRRAGHAERARLVSLRKQQRRRERLNLIGKAWSWFLWATVGYGYRTWQAALWLVALLATGTAAFSVLHPSDLAPVGDESPDWNAVVYTADVVFPIMDLGHQSTWQANGAAAWWVLGLTLSGWLLVTAIVAGLSNALKRD